MNAGRAGSEALPGENAEPDTGEPQSDAQDKIDAARSGRPVRRRSSDSYMKVEKVV